MKAKVTVSRCIFVLYIVTVGYLCLHNFNNLPVTTGKVLGIATDKVVHFCMFFPFPFLAYISYDKRTYSFWQSLAYIISSGLLAFSVALATEYLQSFVPSRCPDKMDLLADCIGIVSCSLPIFIYDIIDNTKHNKTKHRKHR